MDGKNEMIAKHPAFIAFQKAKPSSENAVKSVDVVEEGKDKAVEVTND